MRSQTIFRSRWVEGVCWTYAHLHQHPQVASPRSCQTLFDCLRATTESTGRHGQDSLVEPIYFPWFFHVQHQQDPTIHAWLPQAPKCAPQAPSLQPHWPPHWRSRVCARSRARYNEGAIEHRGSKVLYLFHGHSYHLEELRESLRSTRCTTLLLTLPVASRFWRTSLTIRQAFWQQYSHYQFPWGSWLSTLRIYPGVLRAFCFGYTCLKILTACIFKEVVT